MVEKDKPMPDPAAAGPEELIRRFYACRRTDAPDRLRSFLDDQVIWREPEVDQHMGELRGPNAVIDMIRRAGETTGGSFVLDVGRTITTGNACAAVIHWRASKNGQTIEGREMAVFRIEDGRIIEAVFFPEDIADDRTFWG